MGNVHNVCSVVTSHCGERGGKRGRGKKKNGSAASVVLPLNTRLILHFPCVSLSLLAN